MIRSRQEDRGLEGPEEHLTKDTSRFKGQHPDGGNSEDRGQELRREQGG